MARRHLWCGPDLYRTIVASRREHEWVGSRIPSDASHVAPQSWSANVVQVGCGFAVPYVNVPDFAISLSIPGSKQSSESWLTFSCTEYELVISPSEGTGAREIHHSLGDVRMTKGKRHCLDWIGLFPVIERYQFPKLRRDLPGTHGVGSL